MGESWDRRQAAEDRWRGALDVHRDDALAHSPMRHELVESFAARFLQLEARVTRQEQLGYEVRGGLAVLAALVTGGLFVEILHLLRVIP